MSLRSGLLHNKSNNVEFSHPVSISNLLFQRQQLFQASRKSVTKNQSYIDKSKEHLDFEQATYARASS